MEPFEHADAASLAAAIDLLGADCARPIAGGTDLLTTMKVGIATPTRLVNLKTISGLDTITDASDGLRLGALVTLDRIAADPLIRERYRALAEAAGLAASPQLRNMGTLGGNLAQETRCWYYRNPDFKCWLKGGETCFARDGVNSHHAIFTESPCVSVYPSDPATALLALGATVVVQSASGERRLPIGDYFTLPSEANGRRLHVLGPADLIVAVELPAPPNASLYLKAMDRAAWSFALAGVAVAITWRNPPDGGEREVETARIALGGVAPAPRRASASESYLAGKPLDGGAAAEAGRLAVNGATPLAGNAYKLRLVSGLIARALLMV